MKEIWAAFKTWLIWKFTPRASTPKPVECARSGCRNLADSRCLGKNCTACCNSHCWNVHAGYLCTKSYQAAALQAYNKTLETDYVSHQEM